MTVITGEDTEPWLLLGLAGSCHQLKTAEPWPSGLQAELSSPSFDENAPHRAPCRVQ